MTDKDRIKSDLFEKMCAATVAIREAQEKTAAYLTAIRSRDRIFDETNVEIANCAAYHRLKGLAYNAGWTGYPLDQLSDFHVNIIKILEESDV